MSSAPQPAALYVPTQDERTYAMQAEALQMVGGWIGPLVILCIKRESKFVCFHALQALLLHLIVLVGWLFVMAAWFTSFFAILFTHLENAKSGPPFALFILFPLLWLGVIAMWGLILTCAIVFAIKASHGEWANYPVIGNWARRILHLSDDGAGGVVTTRSNP